MKSSTRSLTSCPRARSLFSVESAAAGRNHFEALTPRIYELGGKLPDDIRTLADAAGCPDAYLPDSMGGAKKDRKGTAKTAMGDYPSLEGKPVKDLLTVLVEAERCAIRTYTDICNMTFGKDHRTYDLSLSRS